MFFPLQLIIWRWGGTFGPCKYHAPYQNFPLNLASIYTFCFYPDDTTWWFSISSTVFIFTTWYSTASKSPSSLAVFFFFLINKGSWIISPTLIYNSSNYFSAHIVLVIVHGSSPFKLVYVCYMPLFKGTSLLSGIT